jgi:hypothetical protein
MNSAFHGIRRLLRFAIERISVQYIILLAVLTFLSSPVSVASGAEPDFSKASPEQLKQLVATFINLNGLLCAEVKDLKPLELKNQWEVTCIEYRGGSGTVRYIFNAETGTAFRAD